MDKEEGEMSDDNAMLVDDVKEEPITKQNSYRTVLYKTDRNGIIVQQQLEKVDASKLEERGKRFGLNLSGNRVVTQTQIDELYTKAGITGNERHFRFDTLHLNGIDGLTTREIFEYLEDYKPVSMEKIDDVSCNIVCQDHIAAALALLVHSREIKNSLLNQMLKEKSQHHWRDGMPHPKKDLILMRFATNGDKKISKKKPDSAQLEEMNEASMDSISKNPWGDLSKSWGVYDHQEVFQRKVIKNDFEDEVEEQVEPIRVRNKKLAMRLGKRRNKDEESEDSNSDSEWKKKSKTPRMRMHADDEETKHKKKKIQQLEDEDDYEEVKDFYTPLSIEVVNSKISYIPRETTKLSEIFKSHKSHTVSTGSIQSRLGIKVNLPEEQQVTEDSDESEHFVPSRVQKITNSPKSTSVWSRLQTKGNDVTQNDLREVLKSKKDDKNQKISFKPDDLRQRLSKAKKSNLRIEIDNC